MKLYIVLSAIIAVSIAATTTVSKADILKYNSENIGVDGYKFAYETSDGVQRSEEGVLKNAGSDKEAIAVQGSISYVDNEGHKYSMTFVADENGYQPVGDFIPK